MRNAHNFDANSATPRPLSKDMYSFLSRHNGAVILGNIQIVLKPRYFRFSLTEHHYLPLISWSWSDELLVLP